VKIIFLNAWNGRVRPAITDFLKQQAKDTDVFCFQEAFADMKQLCTKVLANYQEYSAYKFVTKADDFAQLTYVRRGVTVASTGVVLEHTPDCGLGLYVEVVADGQPVYICNFHGMSVPGEKRDDPARLTQSTELIRAFKDKAGQVIIGGDFNIMPNTKSIHMFKAGGYRDLIQDFSIATTRNMLVWQKFPENQRQYYSDYAFISSSVKLASFSVPENEISDHLPLILEIQIMPGDAFSAVDSRAQSSPRVG